MDNKSNKYLNLLLIILGIKAFIILGLILSGMIGLGPDEAQYWTWSQKLDWGYYSKPAGIAWQIWLGTALFGNTELGVRFLSLVIGFAMPILVYALGKKCQLSNAAAFWAGLLLTLSPLGFLGSFFTITDVGMSLFWLLAIYFALDARYPLVGLMIAFGALFKWPIYLFWAAILPLFLLFPWLRNRSYFTGIAISLLGLIPSVIWNSMNGWPTFLHVYYTIIGSQRREVGTTPLPKGNFFEFLGAQAALIGPIIFIVAVIAFIGIYRNRKSVPKEIQFCTSITLLLFFIYLALSTFKKMQGNWCDFIYPVSFICIAWYMVDYLNAKKWLSLGVTVSTALLTFVLSIPYIQSKGVMSQLPISYKLNLFHHNLGWKELNDALLQTGYDPQKYFLFGDKYQTTSEASFYGPEQKRAYFLNLEGARRNQFSYWPSMAEEQLGKDGYFIRPENIPYLVRDQKEKIAWFQKELEIYFDRVEFLGVKPLFKSYDEMVKGVFIFKCINYNGKEPVVQQLY